MSLDPNTILTIDKARMSGADPAAIHAALEQAGQDPNVTLAEYMRTPLGDGRLRGEVNLGDPLEWETYGSA